jgi:hypothetical protein
VHGVGAIQLGFPPPSQLLNVQAFPGTCSAEVTDTSLITNFVYRVNVALPHAGSPCGELASTAFLENYLSFTLSFNGAPTGPRVVPTEGPTVNFSRASRCR